MCYSSKQVSSNTAARGFVWTSSRNWPKRLTSHMSFYCLLMANLVVTLYGIALVNIVPFLINTIYPLYRHFRIF
jgi:hypothetical protein